VAIGPHRRLFWLALTLILALAFALKRESHRVAGGCAGADAEDDGAALALAVMLMLALALALMLAFALKRKSQRVTGGCAGAGAEDRTRAEVRDSAEDDGASLVLSLMLALMLALAPALALALALVLMPALLLALALALVLALALMLALARALMLELALARALMLLPIVTTLAIVAPARLCPLTSPIFLHFCEGRFWGSAQARKKSFHFY
jgi:hypothetical protein